MSRTSAGFKGHMKPGVIVRQDLISKANAMPGTKPAAHGILPDAEGREWTDSERVAKFISAVRADGNVTVTTPQSGAVVKTVLARVAEEGLAVGIVGWCRKQEKAGRDMDELLAEMRVGLGKVWQDERVVGIEVPVTHTGWSNYVSSDIQAQCTFESDGLLTAYQPDRVTDDLGRIQGSFNRFGMQICARADRAMRFFEVGKLVLTDQLRDAWELGRDSMVELSSVCMDKHILREGDLTPMEKKAPGPDVWVWMDDDSDDIWSMSDGMQVQISAGRLRDFLLRDPNTKESRPPQPPRDYFEAE